MKTLLKKIIVTLLTWEARLVLARYKPKIVVITGNVGKTSTKDAVWSVLAGHFHARKSHKSFNSDIGLPLTILGLQNGWNNPFLWLKNIFHGFLLCLPTPFTLNATPYPQWLVLEVGADRPGDIERVSKWLAPDVVVVTRFGAVPVHIEFFSSPKELIKEKGYLVASLKDTGTLILNADDEDVMGLRDTKRECRLITFGMEKEADFEASNFEITYENNVAGMTPTGITFKLNYAGNSVPITLYGTLGRHQVYPIISALAFGAGLGLNMVPMMQNIKEHMAPVGRMKIIEGVKNTVIIDDTYNAAPLAVQEALRTLGEIKASGRRVAVLGDMFDLGKYSSKEHEKVGKEAAKVADILITVGLRSRDTAMSALDDGLSEKNIFQFDEVVEAGKFVQETLKEGDIILVKGSQGMRMERIVEEIMAHPEYKEKLLVRQEPEWSKR